MAEPHISSKTLEKFFSKAQSLIDTQAYFLDKMKAELREVRAAESISPEILLKATAYIYAHGGYNDLAINELNALIAVCSDTTHHANKLAQIFIRRGKDGDYAKALEISQSVLESAAGVDKDVAWFAYHNAALASLALGEIQDAIIYSKNSLECRDDERTRAILDQALAPSNSKHKFLSFASTEGALSSGSQLVVSGFAVME